MSPPSFVHRCRITRSLQSHRPFTWIDLIWFAINKYKQIQTLRLQTHKATTLHLDWFDDRLIMYFAARIDSVNFTHIRATYPPSDECKTMHIINAVHMRRERGENNNCNNFIWRAVKILNWNLIWQDEYWRCMISGWCSCCSILHPDPTYAYGATSETVLSILWCRVIIVSVTHQLKRVLVDSNTDHLPALCRVKMSSFHFSCFCQNHFPTLIAFQ